MNNCILKDLEKKYIEAVKCYETEIKETDFPNIDSFINLAFLYWSFAAEQIEFNEPNHISDEWSIIGGDKFLPTLDKGLKYYPMNLELIFWRKYFLYRLCLSNFSESECKELLKEYGFESSLVPYFFLHLFDKSQYTSKIIELKRICNELPTAKNIYINSFLELD